MQAQVALSSAKPASIPVGRVGMPELDGAEIPRQALDYDSSGNRRFIIVAEKPLDAKEQLDALAVRVRQPTTNEDLLAGDSSFHDQRRRSAGP